MCSKSATVLPRLVVWFQQLRRVWRRRIWEPPMHHDIAIRTPEDEGDLETLLTLLTQIALRVIQTPEPCAEATETVEAA